MAPAPHSSRRSSRRRFAEYLENRRKRRAEAKAAGVAEQGPDRPIQKRARSFLTLLRAFWILLAEHRPRVIAALGTLTISALLALVLPAGIKPAIDYILSETPGPAGIPRWIPVPEWAREDSARGSLLWMLGSFLVAVTVARVLIGMWGRWQMTRITKRIQASLRRDVFEHAVALPLHRVHHLKSGGVASILREDAGGAGELLFNIIYNPWNAIVQLVGVLTILAVVDWKLVAGALLLVPVVWYSHRTWIGRIRPMFRDIKQTRTSIDAHATEAFGGIRVVRGFDRAKGETGRFSTAQHFMARQEILTWWWSRGIEITWSLLIPVASTAVLVYGGTAVLRGQMTIGDLMMFSMYVVWLLSPLEILATSAASMQTNLAAFDRVLDLLEEPREFAEARGDRVVHRAEVQGRIALRGVWFSYPVIAKKRPESTTTAAHPDPPPSAASPSHRLSVSPSQPPGTPVLKDITLDVEPGQTIALVGPSGSGKTTLCNLIARFYDPTQGTIELDGIDLRQIDVGSYRRLLGIVEQDVFLFDGTVAENIGYGRRGATRADIAEAARQANAAGFIEKLENGYDTVIGERGVRLSGGQKQRLAIARALLADPRILILDEATSNLDTESERLIQRSLARLMRGRTSFVIAHRLSTIRHADRIVVIEDGRMIETGTHDQLLASGGRYAEFLRMQVEGHRPEAAPPDAAAPSGALENIAREP
ncbi:MAG: ABC transporter ATP-binding protein [Phycisphaerales bacterium]